MPQGGGNQGKKKKKGHKPAHQNSFAFHHNPKSKLTDKILSSPNEGVCQRCYDKIEWRKKYRKYKPLTQPAKCNLCHQRKITRAYHTICQDCSRSKEVYAKLDEASQQIKRPRICAVCVKEPIMIHSDNNNNNNNATDSSTPKDEVEQLEEELVSRGKMLKLRERKALERKVEKLRREEKERKRIERKLAAGITVEQDENDSEEGDNDSIYSDEEENDETQDDLLEAVGGKDKLLTGEAYQQMLLQKANAQTT